MFAVPFDGTSNDFYPFVDSWCLIGTHGRMGGQNLPSISWI